MVLPQSQPVIAAAKSDAANPNFIFHTKDVTSFSTEMVNDLRSADLTVNCLDLSAVDFHAFLNPSQETIDCEVLVLSNVQSCDYISAGMLIALIMTRLTGTDFWKGKTVILVARDEKWDDPELKSLLEDLIEAGTMSEEE